MAIPTITPPAGHSCTDPSVNEGCEHFGVGYYGAPTTIKYNWLVDGGAGNLVTFGSPVSVATPSWVYTPPAPLQPAQVVAAIRAPVVPIPAGKAYGEPNLGEGHQDHDAQRERRGATGPHLGRYGR